MSERIAVVDVGTNTALLLVTGVEEGRLVPVLDERRFVRLGQGVDRSQCVSDEALARLERVLREFASLAYDCDARIACVAGTSASRDAANGDRLESVAREACGAAYEVLTGQAEAVLSFAGTMAALPGSSASATVVDVGGGSTELVSGTIGERVHIEAAASADVGSVRVTERFFDVQPPPAEAVEAALSWIDSEIAAASDHVGAAHVLVGAAGTAVVLAGLHHESHPSKSAWPAIDRNSVIAWRRRLLGLSPEEVLALDPELLFGRADVFAGGVLILDRVMAAVGARRLVVSPWGLRHGLALRAAGMVQV